MKPHILLAQSYWKSVLNPEEIAIDMTCGNGHDTLFLANLLSKGKVYSFDIQLTAIEKAKILLGSCIDRVELIHSCHTEVGSLLLPKPPRLVIYNLGYLPRGDKSITTKREQTLQSLKSAFSLLAKGGAISITFYPHEEGEREKEWVLDWLSQMGEKTFSLHEWNKGSPSLLWLKKNSNNSSFQS